MIFTRDQVWQSVKTIAPKFKLDPYLIMAINEQECEHPNNDITQYDCSVARLEQGFYSRYTRKFEYSTGVETLLACSWGPMQMMGESLRECTNNVGQNYFEWYFSIAGDGMAKLLGDPMSPFAVIMALDHYCVSLDVAIEWGCRWFLTKQAKGGNEHNWLLGWNGGSNQQYDDEVLQRIQRLKILCK